MPGVILTLARVDPEPTPDPAPTPDPEPTPDPVDGDAVLEAAFDVLNDWGSGATVNLTITNTGDTAVDDWTVDFDLAVGIANSWNTALVSDDDGYTASDLGYNGRIDAGQSVTIGFNTDAGSLDEVLLNSEADFTFG